jgi:ATP-binding cassette subfamily B multidrug efflux pump
MRDGLDGIGRDPGAITRAGLLLTFVIVVEQAIAFPQMYLDAARRRARDVGSAPPRLPLPPHAQLGFFDRTPVGRLVTRVTNDVDAIGEMFASGALNASAICCASRHRRGDARRSTGRCRSSRSRGSPW